MVLGATPLRQWAFACTLPFLILTSALRPAAASDMTISAATTPGGAGATGASPTTGGCPVALYDNGDVDNVSGFSNATAAVFGARRTLLDDFIVPTGQTWRIDSLRWLHIWDAVAPGSGTGAEISLRIDAGGQPGAVIAVMAVDGYDEIATGRSFFGRAEAESAASFAPIELPSGHYWFEATIVGPDNNFWLTAPVQNNEAWVNYDDLGGLQSGTQQFGSASDLAWCVNGTRVRSVPGEYATIQYAIDAALPGDIVQVAPGVYTEHIDTLGQAITVRSSGGPALTTLHGVSPTVPVIVAVSGEGRDTVIEGFTITNPAGTEGTGVFVSDSDPTITNCVFFDCVADDLGGAVFCRDGSPLFTECAFIQNRVQTACCVSGGAVYLTGSAAEFVGCTFNGNVAESSVCQEPVSRADGGAVYVASGPSEGGGPTFMSCTFENNEASAVTAESAEAFGGAIGTAGGVVTVTDCTFDGNVCSTSGGTFRFGGGGAIAAGDGWMFVDACIFTNNEASGDGPAGAGVGGAFLSYAEAQSAITGSAFEYNVCLGSGPYIGAGGAVHIQDQYFSSVEQCTFIGNTAQRGGGVFIFGPREANPAGTFASMIDCSFNGNTVQEAYDGTGIWNSGTIFASGYLQGADELGNNGNLEIGIGIPAYDTLTLDMPYGDIAYDRDGDGQVDPGATGNIVVEISGPTPGVEHDRIIAPNPLQLSGGLAAFIDAPFDPSVGSSFRVIEGAAQGTFDVGLLPGLGGDRFARVAYGEGAAGGVVRITVESIAALLGFDDPATAGIDGLPADVALGDFDGVNGVDLAVCAPNGTDPGSVLVLRNAGTDGSGDWLGFAGTTQTMVGVGPSSVTAGFFDADSALDLAVTNRGDGDTSVLINDGLGTGSFDPPIDFPTPPNPVGISAADFTGDGVTDLAVASGAPLAPGGAEGDGTVTIFGNDNGTFEVFVSVGGFTLPLNIETGDLDGDKGGFFVVTVQEGVLLFILQDGMVMDPILLPTGDGPGDIATIHEGDENDGFPDLNGDGLPDLVTANRDDETISIMLNAGGGKFQTTVSLPVGMNPRSVTALDIDNDSDIDIALIADDEDLAVPVIQVFRSVFAQTDPQVSFAPVESIEAGEAPTFVRSADLDGDGVLDLVTVNDGDDAGPGALGSARGFLNLTTCTVDLDGSGVADFGDIVRVLAVWGSAGGPEDLDGSGTVDFGDIVQILAVWGTCA